MKHGVTITVVKRLKREPIHAVMQLETVNRRKTFNQQQVDTVTGGYSDD